MSKGPEAFRTISEVAEELNIPQHVLRFWETRFTQIKPVKRGGGRRFYRPDDVALLAGIRHLLYGAGYTIRGVQRILKEQGLAHVQALMLSPVDTTDASLDAVASALTLDDSDSRRIADSTPNGVRDQEPDSRPVERKLDDVGLEVPSIAGALLPHGLDSDLNVNRPSGNYRVDARSPPQKHQPPSSTSLDSPVDARVATVSAAYAALTSVGTPFHPRDGFTVRNDEAENAHGNGIAGERAAGASEAQPDAHPDSGASHYAPGPLSWGSLSGRTQHPAEKTDEGHPEGVADHIIQPQYRLTTGTRESLQSALEELRECRRLLGSALDRQSH